MEKWTANGFYIGDESGKKISVQGNYVFLQFGSGPWRTFFPHLGFRILFTAVPFGKYNTPSLVDMRYLDLSKYAV